MTVAPEDALFEKYKSRVGEVLGVSDWLVVTQRDTNCPSLGFCGQESFWFLLR